MQARVFSSISLTVLAALTATSLLVAATLRVAPSGELKLPELNPIPALAPATTPVDEPMTAPAPAAETVNEASPAPAPAAPATAPARDTDAVQPLEAAPAQPTRPAMRSSRFADIDPDSPLAGRDDSRTSGGKFKPAAGP